MYKIFVSDPCLLHRLFQGQASADFDARGGITCERGARTGGLEASAERERGGWEGKIERSRATGDEAEATLSFRNTRLKKFFVKISCNKVVTSLFFLVTFQRVIEICRAVFNWVSKEVCVCFGFALLWSVIGLNISRHFLFTNHGVKPKPTVSLKHPFSRAWRLLHVFPSVIGSLSNLCLLWLARVITLVLVFRHDWNPL